MAGGLTKLRELPIKGSHRPQGISSLLLQVPASPVRIPQTHIYPVFLNDKDSTALAMGWYCSTCSYDPNYNGYRSTEEDILPDPETDKLALSICRTIDDGRSASVIKQVLRAKEIIAMVSIVKPRD